MSSLKDDIKPVAEETAAALAKAFSEAYEATTVVGSDTIREACKKLAIMAACTRISGYMKKLSDATFLTRWYWLRKISKAEDHMAEMVEKFREK